MTNSSVYRIWKHKMVDRGSSTVTIQTIRDDGTYETHMIFSFGGGCEQHIHHHGTFEIGDATLKLSFESGETRMTGCTDPSKNFDTRDFTEAEAARRRGLNCAGRAAYPHGAGRYPPDMEQQSSTSVA